MSAAEPVRLHVESTLPRPWEEAQTFHGLLYEWMDRAPWLALSTAAHLLLFFVLMAVPWEQFGGKKGEEIHAQLQTVPEEVIEEPDEVIEPEIVEEVLDEPVLQNADVVETEEDFAEIEADSDFFSDTFDPSVIPDEIGLGGGPEGKLSQRLRGRDELRRKGGAAFEEALKDALDWLKEHQSPEGYWDADGFMESCGKIGSSVCDGAGSPTHDVGLTALALLAFLGDGNTTGEGQYKDVVSKGINWLREQQDPDTGLFGDTASHDFIYNHAIATLAISEAYYFSKSPLIKRTAQNGVNYILRARNPYGAWRYDVPPIGDNDTSVTGWMIFALASARDAGLTVDPAALEGGLAWLDEVSDPATGRVGYDNFGSLSSRTPANEHYPREKGEAMTAVGLLCRVFLGQTPDDTEIMNKHADLLRRTPPKWDPEGFGSDMYYWYYGAYAMYQMGGSYWKVWKDELKGAVIDTQRRDGDEKGSWDPVGPWGHAGGRVYATALMTLCIEVFYRYARVLGAR